MSSHFVRSAAKKAPDRFGRGLLHFLPLGEDKMRNRVEPQEGLRGATLPRWVQGIHSHASPTLMESTALSIACKTSAAHSGQT